MRNQEQLRVVIVRQKLTILNQFQQLYFQAMQLQQLQEAGKLPPEFTNNMAEETDHALLQKLYSFLYHLE